MTKCDASLLDQSIRQIGVGYRDGTGSPVEVTRACLARIDETESMLHAWVTVAPERALATAATAEREIRAGVVRGPLHGVPIGIKDIFDVEGFPTRCGSEARDDEPPARTNAASVQRLIDGGAVILGKTVTQEFAAGTISPPARNPWDPARIPGGSSGGSAAAVAVGSCFGAMGSDTGGSIRIPAAACGVTGFKPSFGQVPVAGVFPLAWSLDTVGPIARSIEDTWLLWSVLHPSGAGWAATDRALLDPGAPRHRLRIGVPRSFFFEWLHPDVLESIEAVIARLADAEMQIIETSWRDAAAARACAFVVNRVETAAVHEKTAVTDPGRFSRYGPELRLRIAAGLTIPATTYVRALRARNAINESIASHFAEHNLDALLVPALPTTALLADDLVIEGTGLDESVGAGWTRLTMPFNATGQPVLALPCGLDSHGLPVGIQLAGKPGEERALFRVGRIVEEVLGVHAARPRLTPATNRPRTDEWR